ncbi:MAG TPA: tetratricopeptide repeat protein [Opitutaceae bacterium]|nr:tetratricopeptide repeat protein [Opitutaceae bacterium]
MVTRTPAPADDTLPDSRPSLSPPLEGALTALRAALDEFRLGPGDRERQAVRTAARAVAAEVALLPRQHTESAAVRTVLDAARATWESGFLDSGPAAADLAQAEARAAGGWPGLLASTFLVPFWAWPEAPQLAKVPQWLWGEYTRWALRSPIRTLVPGSADAYVARTTRFLEELAGWIERNRGSAAIRAAVEAYLDQAPAMLPHLATQELIRYAHARGRLVTVIARTRLDDVVPEPLSRAGRPLRVGVLARDFAETPENRALRPQLVHLDAGRVELTLFAARDAATPFAAGFHRLGAAFHVLPAGKEERLTLLRSAMLDVLVFAADLSGVTDDITGLATHRIAPLQCVTGASAFSPGLPGIDLRLIGEAVAERGLERQGLLPGAGLSFDSPSDETTLAATRAEFGIAETGTLFVSAARADRIGAEILQAWGRLLTALPEASLLLLLPADTDPAAAEEIPARLQAMAGAAASRLIVSFDDSRRGLALADVYLDSYPASEPEALASALAAEIPGVTWSGPATRSRAGAALLNEARAGELIGVDEDSYVAIARRLATDCELRAQIVDGLRRALASGPRFADALAASDAWTLLLEHAFDELARVGPKKFLRQSAPLRASRQDVAVTAVMVQEMLQSGDTAAALAAAQALLAQDTASSNYRALLSRACLGAGDHVRALTYALAALQHHEGQARRWLDVADALRANGRIEEALQAYEACLRIEPRCLDALVALAELASAAGHAEFVQDAVTLARSLDASDPRLAAFAHVA